MPHSPIHTLKAHFPQCFDKNGDLMPHKLQEAILDLAQENQANLAQQSTNAPKQKDNANSTAQSDTAQDLQEQDTREKDAILSLSKETYTLNWLGKSYAKLLRHLPTDTLIAQDLAHNAKAEHKDSKNVLIKGDNLEVLKHLKNAYYNKIKMIYIDPPYNTGNDGFIYNDERNFTPQSLAQMANIEIDEANKILNYTLKNSSTHSAWLSFMYPRLYIARQLLRDDGVIFISIDDNEQANLKILCDEIFGEENFCRDMIWLKGNAQNDADTIQRNHETILCYAKNIESNPINKILQNKKVEVFKDEKTSKFYYEGAGLTTGGAGGTLNARPNLGCSIYYNPNTQDIIIKEDYNKEKAKVSNNENEIYKNDSSLVKQGYEIIRPPKKVSSLGRWTWGLDKFNENKDSIIIRKSLNKYAVLKKEWLESKKVKKDSNGNLYAMIEKENPPKSFIDFASSGLGTTELKNIMGSKVFNNPKNTKLLKYLLQISTTPHIAQTGGGGRTPKRKLCA